MDGNHLTHFNWKGVPWDVNFFSLEGINTKYEQYKTEHPYLDPLQPKRALVEELTHVSLLPPGFSDLPVFKKGGRLFWESYNEMTHLGFIDN